MFFIERIERKITENSIKKGAAILMAALYLAGCRRKDHPEIDYSAREIVGELHAYFHLPISTENKILTAVILGVILLMIIYIAYKAMQLIWKGEERKKLL